MRSELASIENLDVTTLISLNNKLKEPFLVNNQTNYNQGISDIWFDSGKYMTSTYKFQVAEICFFMAHIYDKLSISKLQHLIVAFVNNKKYSHAIVYLKDLYKLVEEPARSKFWETAEKILPVVHIQEICDNDYSYPLETIISRYELDNEEPMTWICLSYILKNLNFEILANQAYDNALALHTLVALGNQV